MQLATFNAVCHVELGDKVRFASTIITEITDIRCIHYLKSRKVEFEFELANLPGLWGKREDFVYPIPEESSESAPEPKQYKDDRGWIYFVRGGIGENQYKAFYRRPEKPKGIGEHGYRNTPWCETFDLAQKNLDALALVKGWKEIN